MKAILFILGKLIISIVAGLSIGLIVWLISNIIGKHCEKANEREKERVLLRYLKDLIIQIDGDYKNENLNIIFDTFLKENKQKILNWNVNLFIANICKGDSYWDQYEECYLWLNTIEKYRDTKGKLSITQNKTLNILEGSYLSSIFSLDYSDVDPSLCQIFYDINKNQKINVNTNSLTLSDKIREYYKEILELKESLRESNLINGFFEKRF